MVSEREHQMAIAFAQAAVISSNEEHDPVKLDIFEEAYKHSLDQFEGHYPDLK